MPKEVIEYIANIIKLHDTFSEIYFAGKLGWPMCDCYTAAPFQKAKDMIIKIFNEPKLYERRKYVPT